jgi:hypothetical protein
VSDFPVPIRTFRLSLKETSTLVELLDDLSYRMTDLLSKKLTPGNRNQDYSLIIQVTRRLSMDTEAELWISTTEHPKF